MGTLYGPSASPLLKGAIYYKPPSAGSALTIAEGLDGDRQYGYTTIARTKLTTGGSLFLRPNGVSTNQGYQLQRATGSTSSASRANTGMYIGDSITNEWAFFVVHFWATRSPVAGQRHALSCALDEFAGNVNQLNIIASTWRETATRITSLVWSTGGTIGTDSEFWTLPWR